MHTSRTMIMLVYCIRYAYAYIYIYVIIIILLYYYYDYYYIIIINTIIIIISIIIILLLLLLLSLVLSSWLSYYSLWVPPFCCVDSPCHVFGTSPWHLLCAAVTTRICCPLWRDKARFSEPSRCVFMTAPWTVSWWVFAKPWRMTSSD